MATNFKSGGAGQVESDGVLWTVQTPVTARAGGGQALATPVTGPVVEVTVVASAADSIRLPAPPGAGYFMVIRNSAANSMQVFGAGTDTINGVATGTGVAHAANTTAEYISLTSGTAARWVRNLSA